MMIEKMHFLMILLCLNLNFLPEIHIAVLKKDKKNPETQSISLYHIPSIWEIFFCDSFSVIFCSHSILETWAFFSASKKVQNFMYLVHHWKFKVNFVSLAKQWVFFFMCQGTSNDFLPHPIKQSVYITRSLYTVRLIFFLHQVTLQVHSYFFI